MACFRWRAGVEGPPNVEALRRLVGLERSLGEVAQALHFDARRLAADSAGAMLVTCADEAERECAEAFQSGFVRFLLPSLKFGQQAAFRVANLGGRYEWGAARIAEGNFATESAARGFKLLVVKINGHVAVDESEGAPRFGVWRRYDRDSNCCGALNALLSGSRSPFAEDLREMFESEGLDRLAVLRDPERVDPTYRPLFASMLSARLQARKAVLDVQDHDPAAPTFYLVLPCATLNRAGRDTEIVCGVYTVDARASERPAVYYGLGDDPAAFVVRSRNRLLEVADENVGKERRGRDHRTMALEEWRRRSGGIRVHDPRLERVERDVTHNRHQDHHHARALLRVALPVLAEVAPVPAAIVMFAQGAADIHHAFRVHRLSKELEGTEDARRILDEIHGRIDSMAPERAQALVELLMREYRA